MLSAISALPSCRPPIERMHVSGGEPSAELAHDLGHECNVLFAGAPVHDRRPERNSPAVDGRSEEHATIRECGLADPAVEVVELRPVFRTIRAVPEAHDVEWYIREPLEIGRGINLGGK